MATDRLEHTSESLSWLATASLKTPGENDGLELFLFDQGIKLL